MGNQTGCSTCVHKGICKFEDSYDKLSNKITEITNDNDFKRFNVIINCDKRMIISAQRSMSKDIPTMRDPSFI